MTTLELERYIGQNVRTTRPATDAERAYYGTDDYGGEGVVIEIFERNGYPYFAMDWGMAWAITDDTVIEVLPA